MVRSLIHDIDSTVAHVSLLSLLSRLICHSLTEDRYGVVQRDIPRVVECFVECLVALEEYQAEVQRTHAPKPVPTAAPAAAPSSANGVLPAANNDGEEGTQAQEEQQDAASNDEREADKREAAKKAKEERKAWLERRMLAEELDRANEKCTCFASDCSLTNIEGLEPTDVLRRGDGLRHEHRRCSILCAGCLRCSRRRQYPDHLPHYSMGRPSASQLRDRSQLPRHRLGVGVASC